MTLETLLSLLSAPSVPEGLYTVGNLGGGEIYGIEQRNDKWCVYYSERGEKRSPKFFDSESDAVIYFAKRLEKAVLAYEGRSICLVTKA